MLRISRKPGKQLMYLALLHDRHLSKGKKIGVDFGCKKMANRPIFRTTEYYGVDLDQAALQIGLAKYPDAKAVHANILDAKVPPADFALCINVFFGTNFDLSSDIEVLKAIVRNIAPDGTLIITLQKKRNWETLVAMLREAFRRVDIIAHNLPNKPETIFAPLIAARHYYFPPKLDNWQRLYCRCTGRVDPSRPL